MQFSMLERCSQDANQLICLARRPVREAICIANLEVKAWIECRCDSGRIVTVEYSCNLFRWGTEGGRPHILTDTGVAVYASGERGAEASVCNAPSKMGVLAPESSPFDAPNPKGRGRPSTDVREWLKPSIRRAGIVSCCRPCALDQRDPPRICHGLGGAVLSGCSTSMPWHLPGAAEEPRVVRRRDALSYLRRRFKGARARKNGEFIDVAFGPPIYEGASGNGSEARGRWLVHALCT